MVILKDQINTMEKEKTMLVISQPRPQGFSLKKWVGREKAGKGHGIGWSRAQPKYS